jgi:hypothetical protein
MRTSWLWQSSIRFGDGAARHERERAARELERVDVGADRLEDVLEMATAEGVVVGAARISVIRPCRLARPPLEPEEREGAL